MFSSKGGSWSLCIVGVLCFFGSVNGQLQCRAGQTTVNNVTGTVEFGPLSEGSDPVDTSFDPGAIGGWNSLANGFVDTVQRSSLPFDILVDVINSTFLTSSQSSQGIDPLALLQNFASWWAGILVVTLLGIFFGILFLIVGACFWCCRCCGNCGGAKSQRIRERNDCLTFTFAAILLLCTLVLLAAAVLAFFSNEQTFNSVNNFQTTLNTVIQDGSDYISETTREIDDLICQGASNEGVLAAVVGEINGLQQDLTSEIASISNQFSDVVVQLNSSAISDVGTQLNAITSSVSTVNTTLNSIVADLTTAESDLTQAATQCMAVSPDCSVITNVQTAVSMALSQIPVVPDVSGEIDSIQRELANVSTSIGDALATIDTLSSDILNEIEPAINQIMTTIEEANNTFAGVSDMLNQLVNPITNTSFPASSCPELEEAFTRVYLPPVDILSGFGQGGAAATSAPFTPPADSFELTLGYVNECVINASFDYIRQFDVYRYAVGIVICCLALITIVLVWVGILCGLLGFRKDRYPHDRSKVSHCGGILLLVAVGLTFLFGFLLLLISGIFFFLGSNSFKLCQSLEGPEYEVFAETIDQPTINSALLRGTPADGLIPSISQLLRDCEQNNTALFTAIDLNRILLTVAPQIWPGSIEGAINQQFNISALREMFSSMIGDFTSNLNLNQTQSEISNFIQQAQDTIPSGSLGFNVTEYIQDFEGAVATANLNDSIMSLRNASEVLGANGQAMLASALNDTANILMNIQEVSLVDISMQLTQLQGTVDGLVMIADGLRQNVTVIGNQVIDLIANITGPQLNDFINQTVQRRVDRSFGYLSQYLGHLDDQLVNSVGGCQPITGVYTQMHNTVCRNFVGGLNGFWWSLGFCSLLFVPVIIFAVITASFFLRKKAAEEDEDGYLAYPMKSY